MMPGLVWGETQERQSQLAGLKDMFVASAKTTRVGRPTDLAGVVAFSLSDESYGSTVKPGISAARHT
jgi:hypothetical protein